MLDIEVIHYTNSSMYAIFSQGENPAVNGGRESDTC